MNKTILASIQDGHKYSRIWPLEPKLGVIFPEFRIIKAVKLGLNVVPFIAVLSVFVQVHFLSLDYLAPALSFALFVLSMPVQGLFWLGKRANTILPPQEAFWYREVYEKMADQGVEPRVTLSKPRYSDLAYLLKEIYDKMDNAFKRELF